MKSFKISVDSAFPEWNRYAVYVTAVCFDAAGAMIDYVNLTGDATGQNAPNISASAANHTLETPPCDRVEVYLYVIAREFPASPVIASSPPFDVSLKVTPAGEASKTFTFQVNQWGGLSVKQSFS